MISTNDFRPGLTVEIDGQIHEVVESQHVKPGKGQAFVRAKLRNLVTGTTVDRTMRAGEKVPTAHLERRRVQLLYRDGTLYYFMDGETYEQTPVAEEQLQGAEKFLRENAELTLLLHDGTIIGVDLPSTVDLEVVDTVPGLRGDTVSGGSKPAELETGLEVQVPLFISEGDVVSVDTRTGEYVERASS